MITELAHFFAIVSLIAIPIYISNGMALVFGGHGQLDLGLNFIDHKPLFGKGKTFSGTLAGIIFGSAGSLAVMAFFPNLALVLGINYFYYGFLLASGAMAGDIFGSFLKRRVKVERGQSFFLLDQLDFILGGIGIGMLAFVPSIWHVLFLAAVTVSVHKFGNVVAFKTKMKSVPW